MKNSKSMLVLTYFKRVAYMKFKKNKVFTMYVIW